MAGRCDSAEAANQDGRQSLPICTNRASEPQMDTDEARLLARGRKETDGQSAD